MLEKETIDMGRKVAHINVNRLSAHVHCLQEGSDLRYPLCLKESPSV